MTHKQRHKVEMLEHRRRRLIERIDEKQSAGKNDSWDRAEESALRFAIAVIEAADKCGIIKETD